MSIADAAGSWARRTDVRRARRGWIGAVVVILVAASVRALVTSRTDALWRDEANDVFVCRNSPTIGALLTNIRTEGSPPVRFLTEYAIHHSFPNSIAPARAVAVAFGTLAVVLTLTVGWRAFGAPAGMLAALLMATSPFFIRFSVDLRGYGQFQFASALYALTVVMLVERPTVLRSLAAGATGGTLLLTHYYGFFLLLAGTVGPIVLTHDRRSRGLICASGVTAVALFSPWIPGFLAQAAGDLRPWATPNRKGIDMLRVIALPLGTWGSPVVLASLAAGLFNVRDSAAGNRFGTGGDAVRILAVILFAGAVGGNVVAWCAQFVPAFRARLEPWYLLGMAVWLMPLVGMGLHRLFQRSHARWRPRKNAGRRDATCSTASLTPTRWGMAGLGLAVLALGHAEARRDWLRPRSPAPRIAALIEQQGRPDDLIVISPTALASTFNFYYRGAIEQWAPPFRTRITSMPWPGLVARMEDATLVQDMARDIGRRLLDRRRVWLIVGGNLPIHENEMVDPPGRTTYLRAVMATHRQLLHALYDHARPVPIDSIPQLDYWEPARLLLFEPSD